MTTTTFHQQPWTLVVNGPNIVVQFTSQKKLRQWAKDHLCTIRPSPIDERSFYTLTYAYLPMDN